jgi:hypothetical protein
MFSWRNPQRKLSDGFKSGAISVHMWNDQEIGLSWHTSWKCYAESPKQHSLCAAWLHPAWTTECCPNLLFKTNIKEWYLLNGLIIMRYRSTMFDFLMRDTWMVWLKYAIFGVRESICDSW